jgi:hypothetical protein
MFHHFNLPSSIPKKGFPMSILSNILQKLGIQKPAKPTTSPSVAPSTPRPPIVKATAGGKATPAPSARPAAIPVVDVMTKLDNLAGDKSGLDWKVSIVDLLKLLGMDSSFDARKELATELNCPADFMKDSAKMNTWLHKTVLRKIAENGGNIPQSLLN